MPACGGSSASPRRSKAHKSSSSTTSSRSKTMDILHRIGVKTSSPDKVYEALTTVDGLAGWWTDDTTGSTDVGGVLQFRFPPGGFDMEVVEQRPSEHVAWKVVDGPEEWGGTTIDWPPPPGRDLTM